MDRLMAVSVSNVRSLANLRVDLDDFGMLIGENGAGKSTICECFEILRRSTDSSMNFQLALENYHGGTSGMLRWGETTATITADVELEGVGRFTYAIGFGGQSGQPVRLQLEQLVHENVETVFRRVSGAYIEPVKKKAVWPGEVPPRMNVSVDATETVLRFGRHDDHLSRVCDVISGIEVHLGFETQALWRNRERLGHNTQALGGSREPSVLQQAQRLEHGGGNLASVVWSLKNGAKWRHFLDVVRLGIGRDIADLELHATGRNTIELNVRFEDGRKVPAAGLSDGQLNWICLVAMVMVTERRSVLVIDEPELHMHPNLAVRALDVLAAASEQHRVVIATHSDAMLDALESPEKDVRVVRLQGGRTVLEQIDEDFLNHWRPRTLSELRASRGDRGLVAP